MRRSRRRSKGSPALRRTFGRALPVRSDCALLPRFSSRRTRLSHGLRALNLSLPRFEKHLRRQMMETAASKGALAAATVEGLLLVDKPAGVTSHDMVLAVRRAYHERSIGHLGTLDPFAT